MDKYAFLSFRWLSTPPEWTYTYILEICFMVEIGYQNVTIEEVISGLEARRDYLAEQMEHAAKSDGTNTMKVHQRKLQTNNKKVIDEALKHAVELDRWLNGYPVTPTEYDWPAEADADAE